jgi:glycosyltransferase involved in cell wall biosynthesis
LLNKGFPKEKLTVIYNGIAKDFIAEEKSDNFEANSLVSTGRLVEAKGFDILIKAVYLLKTEYNLPVNCYIIGDGPEKKNLRELAESLKVSDNIHFPGKMERHALIQTLIKKHLYVSASRFEGFNLALLEAMALKLPVISTKTGIAEEAIIHTENGILIEKENKHALAEAVYTLIKTPLLAEKIAVKGRETVINNYMIEKTISRLLELYGKY